MKELNYMFGVKGKLIDRTKLMELQKLIDEKGIYTVLKSLKKLKSGDGYFDELLFRFNKVVEAIEFYLYKNDVEV